MRRFPSPAPPPSPEGFATSVSRRGFIQTVSSAGAVMALGGCTGPAAEPDEAATDLPWMKNPDPFIRHPTNLETRLEDLRGLITPNDLFFVRNHAPTPRIDGASYRLAVGGDAVEGALDLGYDELLAMPSRSVVAYLECAGNWRSFSQLLTGQVASGGQWITGAVGCATWTGVPLAAVLERAGVRANAVDVDLAGLDDGAFSRPMPIAKAMDPDTLLVHTMNGERLPPDHGFPIRAVVPGWAGSNSIKWLGTIKVSSQRVFGRNNTTSYVMVGPEWDPATYAPADGLPITTLSIKSALALPFPATLSTGAHRLRGYAHSPHGRIRTVHFSVDGAPWQRAALLDPVLPRAWARFEFPWEAVAGSHTVRVRATDETGVTQPDTVPFNAKGYLLNAPLPHPIEVV